MSSATRRGTSLLLVQPRVPPGQWNLADYRSGYMPNLAIPTLAALTPAPFTVGVWDENLDPLDPGLRPDIVAITGYSNQAEGMKRLGREFRERGSLVCMGGVHASSCPGDLRDHADVLFVGEAEYTWPRFLAAYLRGSDEGYYEQGPGVDLADSPVPDIAGMPARDRINYAAVQTSRGCPHDCEFCSVVALHGHRLRHKPSTAVVEECRVLYGAGVRRVLLADDNLHVHRRRAREVLGALRDYNRANPEDTLFFAQSSIELAREPELLDLSVDAGVRFVFVGVESDDPAALRVAEKRQNLGRDLVEDLRRITRSGLVVHPAMIVGFDTDGPEVFERTRRFVQRTPCPALMLSLLTALPGSRLEARLQAEGRWRGPYSEQCSGHRCTTNVTPRGMGLDELTAGYLVLLADLHAPGAFLERLEAMLALLPPLAPPRRRAATENPARRGDVFELARRIADRGDAHRRVVARCLRLLMEHPGHGPAILHALLYWGNTLALLDRWTARG